MSFRLSTDIPRSHNPHSHPPSRPTSYLQPQNRPSTYSDPYYEQGEERDESFDVRADFDGDGPKWSDVYGMGKDTSYRPVARHVAPLAYTEAKTVEESKEDLVSVPVLGPEWQRSELVELSRRGQAELRQEERGRAWREWNRDQRGMCSVPWLTRRLLVFVLFFLCAGIAVTLYFVLPRAPSFSFYTDQPFTVDNSTISFSRTPTNFSFAGELYLLGADTSASYVPVHFSNIQATLVDLATSKAVATGNYGNHVVPKSSDPQPVKLPVDFSYSAVNASDTTWVDMYNACGDMWPGTTRTSLNLGLTLRMSIVGLTTHPTISTEISGVACPFELPGDGI